MLKPFADFRSKKNQKYDLIELHYSCLFFLSRNPKWFCRIWKRDWVSMYGKTFDDMVGEAYGRNKFEAYRNAVKNLDK